MAKATLALLELPGDVDRAVLAGRLVTLRVDDAGSDVGNSAGWSSWPLGREVAADLGCGWHTVMDAVMLYGTPLVDDPARIGPVIAVGLDETLFARDGPFPQLWSTHIVVERLSRGLPATSPSMATRARSVSGPRPCRSAAKRWRGSPACATTPAATSSSVFAPRTSRTPRSPKGGPVDRRVKGTVKLVEALGSELMVHFSLPDAKSVDSGDPDAPEREVGEAV